MAESARGARKRGANQRGNKDEEEATSRRVLFTERKSLDFALRHRVRDTPACLRTLVYKRGVHTRIIQPRPCAFATTKLHTRRRRWIIVERRCTCVMGKYPGDGGRWVNATSRSDRLDSYARLWFRFLTAERISERNRTSSRLFKFVNKKHAGIAN